MTGWAVVTGASSGIGEEFARELARRGYPVLAVARRQERLGALAKQASAKGGLIEPLTADLATESGVGAVLKGLERLGEIELLINNAGIANAGDFVEASLDREVAAIRLNLEAVVRLTHGALQLMTRRGRGGIVNVASVVAFQPFPHFAVYAATKAFVLSFTEALAEELRGTPVRLLALCPGAVRTEIEVFAHNEGVLGRLPSLTAEQVVKTGLRALERGRVVEVVGGLNQLLPFLDRLMPRWLVRRLLESSVKTPREPKAQNVERGTM